jgi:copper transport protein
MARRGLLLAVLVASFAALAPDAGAHAVLARARPADGSTLTRAPREIRLQFSEAISPRYRIVRVVDGRGRTVRGARVRPDGSHGLRVALPELPRGPYQLSWEVLAEDDGHVTGGAMAFGVGATPGGARKLRAAGAAPAPAEAWLRWLDLGLLVGLIGALTMSALLAGVRGRGGEAARRCLFVAGTATAAGGLVFGLVLLARQVERMQATVAPGSGVADVLGTRWGALWNARELLLAGLVALALWARTSAGGAAARPRPRAGLFAAALVVALVVVRALAGHAAGATHRPLAVAVDAAHVLAAGAWVGGVAAFGLALAAARGEAGALARACRRPFARVAGVSLAVLAVTGLLAAGAQIASVDALLTTDYGRTLIVKSALVAGVAALGLGNALLLRRGQLPRLLPVEVAAGAAVLVAAAVLTASPPAKGPEFAAPRPAVVPTLASQTGDLLVTATARPNRAGPNVITVHAISSRRPPPAPVERAELRLAPAGGAWRTVTLTPQAPGRFGGGAELDADGRWRMTVAIWRAGRRIEVPFDWAVAPPDPARPVTYSARPLAPLLDRAAAVIVLLLGVAALMAAVRRLRWSRARALIEPFGKEAP